MSLSKHSAGKNEIRWHDQGTKGDFWESGVAYGKQFQSGEICIILEKHPAYSTSLSKPEKWCGLVKKEQRRGNTKTQKQGPGPGLTRQGPMTNHSPHWASVFIYIMERTEFKSPLN